MGLLFKKKQNTRFDYLQNITLSNQNREETDDTTHLKDENKPIT